MLDAIETKRFLILTNPLHQTVLRRKAEDVDAYLTMRAGSGANL